MALFPEESEGERFTRYRRSQFTRIDSFADFEMNLLANARRSKIAAWNKTRFRLKRELIKSADATNVFINKDMEDIFQVGMRHGSGVGEYRLTQADKASVRRQRVRAKAAMEAAAKKANSQTNMGWRQAKKYATTDPSAKGAARLLSVKYKNGTRMPYGVHQSMVMRTHAQRTYNLGVIRGGQKAGIEAYEISDGPSCGMDGHDSGDIANGQIVNANDAKRFLLSHPNCTRTFQPRPDLDKPPGKNSPLYNAFQSLKQQSGTALRSSIVQAQLKNLAMDLAFDAEMRRFLFTTAKRGVARLWEIQDRIDHFLLKQKILGVDDIDELSLMSDMQDEINEMMETQDISALSEWARHILMGGKQVQLVELKKAANDFDYLHELTIRAGLTHRELNVLNSVENQYGEFFVRKLAGFFPDDADLGDAFKSFLERYAPSTISGQGSNALGPRVANRLISQGLGKFQDLTTRRIADIINATGVGGSGTVSFPRLGRYLDRLDLFGARYSWGNRALKFESTVVNQWRHFDRDKLAFILQSKGVNPEVVVRVFDTPTIFEDVIRKMTRQELIKALGYKPGVLTHFTLNPQGLFRLGFRFDPAYGWQRPLPVFSIVSKSTPFRYRARLNRGRLVGADLATGFEGVRLRSITQEIYITTGGWLNLNQIPGLAIPTTLNPGIQNIGIRLTTVLNRISEADNVFVLNTAGDLGRIIKNRGIKAILADTEFLSAFAELRSLGWSWFRIGHTLSLNPEQVSKLATTVRKVFGANYLGEAKAATHMALAQSAMISSKVDDVLAPIKHLMYAIFEAGGPGSFLKQSGIQISKAGFKWVGDTLPEGVVEAIQELKYKAEDLYDYLWAWYQWGGNAVKSRLATPITFEIGDKTIRFQLVPSSAVQTAHPPFNIKDFVLPKVKKGESYDDYIRRARLKAVRLDLDTLDLSKALPQLTQGANKYKIPTETRQGIERIVNLDNLSDYSQRVISEQLKELFKYYPEVADRILVVRHDLGGYLYPGDRLEKQALAWTHLPQYTYDHGSEVFWMTKPGELVFRNTRVGLVDKLWKAGHFSAPGDAQTVVHEFGHMFHDTVDHFVTFLEQAKYAALDRAQQQHPLAFGANSQFMNMDSRIQRIVEEEASKLTPKDSLSSPWADLTTIQRQLSRYGSTSWQESFAEALAQVVIQGPQASPLAKAIVKQGIDLLKEIEKYPEWHNYLFRPPRFSGYQI